MCVCVCVGGVGLHRRLKLVPLSPWVGLSLALIHQQEIPQPLLSCFGHNWSKKVLQCHHMLADNWHSSGCDKLLDTLRVERR